MSVIGLLAVALPAAIQAQVTTLASVSLTPDRVTGGGHVVVEIRLTDPAPDTTHVKLQSSYAGLSILSPAPVPFSDGVSVAKGNRSKVITIGTPTVVAPTTVTITAQLGTLVAKDCDLLLLPPSVPELALSALRLDVVGSSLQGRVELSGPAPSGGARVLLGSSHPALASVLADVPIAPGGFRGVFTITRQPVTTTTRVKITAGMEGAAGMEGVARTAPLTLVAPSGTGDRLAGPDRIAVLRQVSSNKVAWILRGEGGEEIPVEMASAPGAQPVPGDYGAGAAQIALFLPPDQWLVRRGNLIIDPISFGVPNAIAVPADYQGTGRVQMAFYQSATGKWFFPGTVTPRAVQWALPGDIPVPGDYDRLGYAQLAVFDPGLKRWFVRRVDCSTREVEGWGESDDVPVPADYLGTGTPAIAYYRRSNGRWYIQGLADSILFPTDTRSSDKLVPGDYLGLGHAQLAVFRKGTGDTAEWWIRKEDGSPPYTVTFGKFSDLPVPAAYAPGFGP